VSLFINSTKLGQNFASTSERSADPLGLSISCRIRQYVGATFPTPCTRARARHACRDTSTTASAVFVYVYNLDTVSRRGGPEGEVSSISRTPLQPTPSGTLLQKPPGERGAPRVGGWRDGVAFSVRPSRLDSSRVTASSAVSQAPSGSIRLPPLRPTPTSSTFYCEKQCTYRLRSRASPIAPLPPPPRVRPSVRPSVRPPVRPSVRSSVRPSARPTVQPSNPPRPDALTSSAASLLSLAASSFRSGCCLLPARAESS